MNPYADSIKIEKHPGDLLEDLQYLKINNYNVIQQGEHGLHTNSVAIVNNSLMYFHVVFYKKPGSMPGSIIFLISRHIVVLNVS